MSEYAKIVDGKVETIIVIEPEMLATGKWGDPKLWVRREDLPKPKESLKVTLITGNATRG